MFNTTIIKAGKTEYVPYEKTVTEIKAPTDDSIRLLNEFKEEALKNTLLLIKVENTQFSFVARYGEMTETKERFATMKFSFNGTEYYHQLMIQDILLSLRTREQVIQYFIKEYEKAINKCVAEALISLEIKDLLNKLKF